MKSTGYLLNYIVVSLKCFKCRVCEVNENSRTEIISPTIDKQTGRRTTEEEDGMGRGVRGDQWANKTNRWNETTEKSEVINLQRQDDPTNRMH